MDHPGAPAKPGLRTGRPYPRSLLGVDSGRIVGLGPCVPLALFLGLLLAAPRLRLAALEVVAQRLGQTPLRSRLFLLLGVLDHTDKVAPWAPLWQGSRRFWRSHAPPASGRLKCCRRSGVEEPRCKGGGGKSNLYRQNQRGAWNGGLVPRALPSPPTFRT